MKRIRTANGSRLTLCSPLSLLLTPHSPLGSAWALAAVVYNRISHPSHPVGIAAFALFPLPFYFAFPLFFGLDIDNIYICVCVCVGGRVVFWRCLIENIKKSFVMGVRRV